jgi:hypothetical protein
MQKRPSKYMDLVIHPRPVALRGLETRFQQAQLIPALQAPFVYSYEQVRPTNRFKSTKYSIDWKRFFIIYLGVVLCIAGVYSLSLAFKNNQVVIEQVKALEQNSHVQVATPDETTSNEPNESQGDNAVPNSNKTSAEGIYNYKVQGKRPKRIEIKSVGIFAKIVRLGINSKGSIDVPISIYDAGWYDGSSYTQDAVGATVIVGHLGGKGLPGIFVDLKKIKKDQLITITNGDESVSTYKVIENAQVPVDTMDMSKYLDYSSSHDARLYLITCSGSYSAKSFSYDHRDVVTAVKI